MSSPVAPLALSALHAQLLQHRALLLHGSALGAATPGPLLQDLEAFGAGTPPQALSPVCRTPPGLDPPRLELPACPVPPGLQLLARHGFAATRGATRQGFSESARLAEQKACLSPRSSPSTRASSADSSPRGGPSPESSRPASPEMRRGTTLLFRRLPKSCLRPQLAALLDGEGFCGAYDLVYCPMDFATRTGMGYAFVNCVSEEEALRVRDGFDGFSSWFTSSGKACEVSWSTDIQGLAAHLERYRNSPVMHEQVPDAFKPALFQGGRRVAFPEPTTALKMPRLRASRQKLRASRRMAPEVMELLEEA